MCTKYPTIKIKFPSIPIQFLGNHATEKFTVLDQVRGHQSHNTQAHGFLQSSKVATTQNFSRINEVSLIDLKRDVGRFQTCGIRWSTNGMFFRIIHPAAAFVNSQFSLTEIKSEGQFVNNFGIPSKQLYINLSLILVCLELLDFTGNCPTHFSTRFPAEQERVKILISFLIVMKYLWWLIYSRLSSVLL